jgi:salicylate hydroxylase
VVFHEWEGCSIGRCCSRYVTPSRYAFSPNFSYLVPETNVPAGSGAGHAIEDCYILGRALHDYFNPPVPTKIPTTLATWTQIYQDVRLPRAQKAQLTSRQAGELYELQGPLFENLTYDKSLPIIAEKITGRMKWVWGGDIDAEYNAVVTKTFGKGPGSDGVTSNGVSSDRISSNDITSNGVH